MKRPGWCVYELEDPRDPLIPRWVGCGHWPDPWNRLWDFRTSGTGRLYDWLRDLDASGILFQLGEFCVGRITGIGRRAAHDMARFRVIQICREYHGVAEGYPDHPPELLNRRLYQMQCGRAVVGIGPQGDEKTFETVKAATAQGYCRSAIYRAVDNGKSYRGLTWRYAAPSSQSYLSRPVERMNDDGRVTQFVSLTAAERATRIKRQTLMVLLETAERDRDNCRWRDAAAVEIPDGKAVNRTS